MRKPLKDTNLLFLIHPDTRIFDRGDELDLLINNVANLNWWRTEPQDFPLVRNSVALTFGHVAFDNREFSHVYI